MIYCAQCKKWIDTTKDALVHDQAKGHWYHLRCKEKAS
jgi:hypothetical protein